MDPKLIYWTAALVNLGVICGCALAGWRQIRRGRVAAHRRWMRIAGGLTVLFLVSYLFKLWLLGREDLSAWSPGAVLLLRVHEAFIGVMVLAGAVNFWLARRLEPEAGTSGEGTPRHWHRWLGRIALVGALVGLLTAGLVLAGMYARTAL